MRKILNTLCILAAAFALVVLFGEQGEMKEYERITVYYIEKPTFFLYATHKRHQIAVENNNGEVVYAAGFIALQPEEYRDACVYLSIANHSYYYPKEQLSWDWKPQSSLQASGGYVALTTFGYAGNNGYIRVFDSDGNLVAYRQLSTGKNLSKVEGELVAVASGNTILVLSFPSLGLHYSFSVPEFVTAVEPITVELVAVGTSNGVYMFNNGSTSWSCSTPYVREIEYDERGNRLLVATDEGIRIFSLEGNLIESIEEGTTFYNIDSSGGNFLFSGEKLVLLSKWSVSHSCVFAKILNGFVVTSGKAVFSLDDGTQVGFYRNEEGIHDICFASSFATGSYSAEPYTEHQPNLSIYGLEEEKYSIFVKVVSTRGIPLHDVRIAVERLTGGGSSE